MQTLLLCIQYFHILFINCPTLLSAVLLITTEINESNSCSHLAVLNPTAVYRNSYYLWMGINNWTVSTCIITDGLIKRCCTTLQKLPNTKKKTPFQFLLLSFSNLLSCWKNHNLEFRKAGFEVQLNTYILINSKTVLKQSLKKKKKKKAQRWVPTYDKKPSYNLV